VRSARVAGVVLAGGAGRRMGGVDKAALRVGGATLLDRVLAAAEPVCDRLVVVGPPRETTVEEVEFTTEAEPGGGPAPAVVAGVASAPDCDTALVLATDLPLLTTTHLVRLMVALQGPRIDAAAAADRRGPNPLLAAYGVVALQERARAAGLGPGSPASALLPRSVATVDLGAATVNVNCPEDLAAAELLADHDEDVVVVTQWLRDLLRATVPDAQESVYEGWHGFGYRHPRAGYFCAVFPRADDVRLSFEQGAALADPRGLLEGSGRQVRHVEVRKVGRPPADHLVELIDAAVDHRPGPA
jgi:molybdopterin-guanine dinucleotide biosynthesis protein A